MFKTFATIAAAATLSMASIVPAHAVITGNGISVNGWGENGVSLNGAGENGSGLNGSGLNGFIDNGAGENGLTQNGVEAGGSALSIQAIELPAAAR